MYSHLVAVEVRVVRITDERVQTDGGAFNQNRFKSLDGEAVQGGRAVSHAVRSAWPRGCRFCCRFAIWVPAWDYTAQ